MRTKTSTNKLGVVELFAGIAGLAQGFADTDKFYIQGLLDIDPIAKESFGLNYSDVYDEQGDIQKTTPLDFLKRPKAEKPFAVLGCPPCQGLSAAGKRDPKDPRNKLIYDFFRYVAALEPSVFIIENVPQILLAPEYTRAIFDFAEAHGYKTWSGVLNCAMFGIPQTRQRALVICYHKSLGIMPRAPKPTHYGRRKIYSYPDQKMVSTTSVDAYERALGWYAVGPKMTIEKKNLEKLLSLNRLVTLDEALDDLPALTARDDADEYVSTPRTDYQRLMRAGATQLTSHTMWGHSAALKKKMRRRDEGGVSRCRKYFSQAYGRLHGKGLGRTITGNFHNPGCGRFTHYEENRTLTVREAARLQGFEDSFAFAGELSDQRRLLGNAFPKVFAQEVARQVIKDLFKKGS